MFFSMKRSLVVFVALGLLAGITACGNSDSEVALLREELEQKNAELAEIQNGESVIEQTVEPTEEDIRLELEARTWVKEYIMADWGLGKWWARNIKSISYGDYVDTCMLDVWERHSFRAGDVDYWRLAKQYLLNPRLKAPEFILDADIQKHWKNVQSPSELLCRGEVLTPQEYAKFES